MASVHDWSIDSGMTSPNRWRMAFEKERGVICFTAKVFFPYLLSDSRLPGDEFQNQNSEFAQGERRGKWLEVRDQWEWPSSEISQATGNEERQQEGEREFTSSKWTRRWRQRLIHVISLKNSWKSEKRKGGIAQCRGLCVYVLCTLREQHLEFEPKLLLQRLKWERYYDLTLRS